MLRPCSLADCREHGFTACAHDAPLHITPDRFTFHASSSERAASRSPARKCMHAYMSAVFLNNAIRGPRLRAFRCCSMHNIVREPSAVRDIVSANQDACNTNS